MAKFQAKKTIGAPFQIECQSSFIKAGKLPMAQRLKCEQVFDRQVFWRFEDKSFSMTKRIGLTQVDIGRISESKVSSEPIGVCNQHNSIHQRQT